MYFTLDLPLSATGSPDAALMNQWARVEQVVKCEQPFIGFNVSSAYDPSVIPSYEEDQWIAQFADKMKSFIAIFKERLGKAQVKGYFTDAPMDLIHDFAGGVTFFASDPRFAALSVKFHDDGEIELARVTADKRNIDYLTFQMDDASGEIVTMFSRFENKQSVINIYGRSVEVVKQIVELGKS